MHEIIWALERFPVEQRSKAGHSWRIDLRQEQYHGFWLVVSMSWTHDVAISISPVPLPMLLTVFRPIWRVHGPFHGYVSGNYYDPNQNGALDGSAIGAASSNYGGMVIMDTQYAYPAPSKILTAPQAVDLAITSVGASLVRDSIDTRLINELQTYGTAGELITNETASPMNGPGTIALGTVALDTDSDGNPDSVEMQMGTDSKVADSMKIGASGYTNIETWANSLVPSSYYS